MCNIGVRGLELARASARSTGRFLAALVIALCALMMGAHDAYAITVRDDGNGYKRAIVYPHEYPNGRYAALAEFLGYDWNSFSQQTKNAIINDNGKFMELYSTRCKNYRYENQNLQDGSGSVIGAITTKLAEVVNSVSETTFGNDETWYCSCTNADYDAARENIEYWLYPRPATEPENPTPQDWYSFSETITSNIEVHDLRDGGTYTYTISGTEVSTLQSWGNPYYFAFLDWPNDIQDDTIAQLKIFTFSENLGYTVEDHQQVGKSFVIYNNTGHSVRYRGMGVGIWETPCVLRWTDSSNQTLRSGQFGYASRYVWPYIQADTGLPPYDPVPDEDPTAPIIQIGDVTIDLRNGPYTINNTTYTAVQDNDNNWTINITNNTTNNYGGDEQASDPTDYTSILNAILAAINSLRSEMTTYSNQVNAALTNMSNSLQTAIKNADTSISNHIKSFNQQMHTDIQTLQTNLQNSYNARMDAFAEDLWANIAALDADLIDELDAVAKYIVEGIHFDSDFSDADIVKWLKMIYSKLKDKKVTVPSPDEDTEGWLDALERLLDELLDVILSGLNVATLASLFDGLKARFPISIPWDIMAIINIFAGGAVTPVFDLPLPKGISGATTNVHVDLTEWDDEMALVRQGELLLFGMTLMLKTKWLFDILGSPLGKGD